VFGKGRLITVARVGGKGGSPIGLFIKPLLNGLAEVRRWSQQAATAEKGLKIERDSRDTRRK